MLVIKKICWYFERMAKFEVLGRCSPFWFVLLLCFAFMIGPGAQGWSKEGHIMTCRIAQVKLKFYFNNNLFTASWMVNKRKFLCWRNWFLILLKFSKIYFPIFFFFFFLSSNFKNLFQIKWFLIKPTIIYYKSITIRSLIKKNVTLTHQKPTLLF